MCRSHIYPLQMAAVYILNVRVFTIFHCLCDLVSTHIIPKSMCKQGHVYLIMLPWAYENICIQTLYLPCPLLGFECFRFATSVWMNKFVGIKAVLPDPRRYQWNKTVLHTFLPMATPESRWCKFFFSFFFFSQVFFTNWFWYQLSKIHWYTYIY